MDEKELQRLYDAMSGKFDIGDFGSFKSKMQTSDDRKRFYDAIGSEGFDLGDYSTYEKRLSGGATQNKGMTAFLQATRPKPVKETYTIPSPKEFNESIPSYARGNQAVSTATTTTARTSAEDFADHSAEKEAANKLVKQQAKRLTAEKRIKSKGIKDYDGEAIGKEEQDIQKDIDEGNLVLGNDLQGNKIYTRPEGATSKFVKSLLDNVTSLGEGIEIAKAQKFGTPEQLRDVLENINTRKRKESEIEFGLEDLLSMGMTANKKIAEHEESGLTLGHPNFLGETAGAIGGLVPDAALAYITGFSGNAAKATAVGTKMLMSSYGNEAPQLYERNKQMFLSKGLSEDEASKQAAVKAAEDAKETALPSAALGTLFFSGALHSPAANNFTSVMKSTVKNTINMAGAGAVESATKSAIEANKGYDTGDYVEKMFEAGGEYGKMGLLFESLPLLSATYKGLPKATKSVIKEFAVDPVVRPFVDNYLKTVPENIGTEISKQLDEYDAATAPLRGVVSEEKMASLGGRMQKRVNRINDINLIKEEVKQLEGKKAVLPESLHEEIDNSIKSKTEEIKSLQKEIGNIDGEIEKINKSEGTGLEYEKDELTGEPIIPIEVPEAPKIKGEPEQISQPIELSTEVKEIPVSEQGGKDNSVEEAKNELADLVNKGKDLYDENGKKIKDGVELTSKEINRIKELQKFISDNENSSAVDWSKDVEKVDLSKVDWKNPTTEESIAGHENHIENNVKKGQQSLLPQIRELAKKYNLTKEQYLKVLPSIRQVLGNAEPNINSIENIISRESGKQQTPSSNSVVENKPINESTKNTIQEAEESKPEEVVGETAPETKGGEEPPKEYDVENGIYAEDKRTHLSHRGMQEIATEFGLPDVKSRDPRSDLQDAKDAELTTEKWNEEGKYSENINKLIDRAIDGQGANPVEKHILQQHIANVRGEAAKMDINDHAYNEKINELDRLKRAGAMLKSTAGATLRNSGIESNPNPTMADWMAERKQSLGVEELSPAQKEETAKMFNDYETKLKASEEKNKQAEEEISKLKAELALKNESAKKSTIRKKAKEVLSKEREDILQSIKDKWNKSSQETSIAFVPYAKQLIEIAPDVIKLANNLKDAGILKIQDIVDNIHDLLVANIPQLTKKDVSDMIAGEYNVDKKLNAAKKGAERTVKNIEERILNKDFEPKGQRSISDNELLRKANPKLWKETMDAFIARDEARDKLELAKREDEFSKRPTWEKALDFTKKLVVTTPKAIKAGIDDSVTFVQLGLAVMANKRLAAKAKIEALKSIDAKYFKRQLAELHNSPMWNLIKESKLDITEPKSLSKENLEELYSGNLLDKNFKIGKNNKGEQMTINPWTYTGGIFERMFTSMGNNLRLKMFESRVSELMSEGKTFESHPDDYKGAARVINELTGRGKVNEHIQKAMPVISPVIWAPKMLSSSFNILGVGDIANAPFGKKGFYRSLTPEQQAYAAHQLIKGIGTGVAVMAAFAARGWNADYNPQSTGFGYITSPDDNRRYNVFGRYAGVVKFLVQSATGKSITAEGKEQDLDKQEGGIWKTTTKFLRGKMTPTAGVIFDYKFNSKRNSFTKEKIDLTDPKQLYQNLLEPISISDLKKGLENDGTISLLTRWLPAVEGIQVQDKRDYVDDLPTLIKRNADPETQDIKKIFNYKKGGRNINKEEFDKYNEERNKKITESITKMYNEGFPVERDLKVKIVPYKEMTRQEIIDATNEIKKKSTAEVKKKMFGKKFETSTEKKAKDKLETIKEKWYE